MTTSPMIEVRKIRRVTTVSLKQDGTQFTSELVIDMLWQISRISRSADGFVRFELN